MPIMDDLPFLLDQQPFRSLNVLNLRMAASRFLTIQYTGKHAVESAGAVLLQLSNHRMCLVHHGARDEWLLAKDRGYMGENRQTAALRETEEETGHRAHLLPLVLTTRCTTSTRDWQMPGQSDSSTERK